jgi:uncharacterized membrane protein HdeD (DUF308 family)
VGVALADGDAAPPASTGAHPAASRARPTDAAIDNKRRRGDMRPVNRIRPARRPGAGGRPKLVASPSLPVRRTVSEPAPRAFEVRHLQMARALFAAIAAIMITFSVDHSAQVGASVFGGFAVATALVLLLSAWLVFPKGDRWQAVLLGILTLVAGMVATLPALRTDDGYFTVLAVWGLVVGAAELAIGILGRRRGTPAAREAVFVGILTIVLGVAMLFIPRDYSLEYYIDEARQSFTLTGITIGVGVFGGYAAIVAVYLGIAAFSPRPAAAPAVEPVESDAAGGRT